MTTIFVMNRNKEISQLTPQEVPDHVKDTIENGMLAVSDGLLYAPNLTSLLGDEFTLDEVKFV